MAFRVRDMTSGTVLAEVNAPPEAADIPLEDLDDSSRFVRYSFPPEFLKLKAIGTEVTFTVGKEPVEDFRMIERHYFRGKVLKSVDFKFGFCMPASRNTCEIIYDMPKLSKSEMADMIAHPWETAADSFFFAGNKLIMHNRSVFRYDGKNDD